MGVALEALGRLEEAATAYTDAIAVDANYAAGHLRLAALRYRQGMLNEAIERFTHALRIEPRNAAARCDLARALLESGQPQSALREYESALLVEPRHPICLVNFTWLLAAHEDPAIRGAHPAVEIGERAVDACRGTDTEALALDALAAANANAGRFGDAVRIAETAMALTLDAELRRDLRERAGLYRRGTPFRVFTGRRP